MVFIVYATHECVIHEECRHVLVNDQFFSYEELRDKIRQIFQLAPSASFVLTYWDGDEYYFGLSNDEELVDAVQRQLLSPLHVKVVQTCSSPFVKVVHEGICRLMTPPPGQLELSYKQLHGLVRKAFKIRPYAEFEFIWHYFTQLNSEGFDSPTMYSPRRSVDRDFDFCCRENHVDKPCMIVANCEDLKYARKKQSPRDLQLSIRIIENDGLE